MIATVNILAVEEHQLSNRQYAVGNLASRVVATCENAKVRGNMVQSIALPWVANMQYANMVEINGKYYDILGVDDVTDEGRQINMNVILNPVATYLHSGQGIAGWWERTPTNVKPGGTVMIGDDAYKVSRKYALNRIEAVDPAFAIPLYIQISSRYHLDTKDSSKITLYGTLAGYMPQFMSWSAQLNYKNSNNKKYISLADVINDFDSATVIGSNPGIPSDSIIDISVSPRCPWRYSFDGTYFNLLNDTGQVVPPKESDPGFCFNVINGYNIGKAGTYGHTVQFSTFERMCGRFFLVDEAGNDIAMIPNQYLNASNQLELEVQTMSDLTGMYTNVMMNNIVYTMQEGHLPWVGDAWNDYRARSLAYDREALARGVETINRQRGIDTANAIGNSMLTASVGMTNPAGAVLGVAQAGLGIYSANQSAELTKDNLYANQAAKEGLIKNSPSNNYQTGYGLDYIFKQYKLGGAHIRVEMPANLTQDDFNNYISYQGWPCNKYATMNVTTGYIKGNLFDLESTGGVTNGPGPDLDMLRREIAQGFRIVVI